VNGCVWAEPHEGQGGRGASSRFGSGIVA
jgi:hypothetical protein